MSFENYLLLFSYEIFIVLYSKREEINFAWFIVTAERIPIQSLQWEN